MYTGLKHIQPKTPVQIRATRSRPYQKQKPKRHPVALKNHTSPAKRESTASPDPLRSAPLHPSLPSPAPRLPAAPACVSGCACAPPGAPERPRGEGSSSRCSSPRLAYNYSLRSAPHLFRHPPLTSPVPTPAPVRSLSCSFPSSPHDPLPCRLPRGREWPRPRLHRLLLAPPPLAAPRDRRVVCLPVVGPFLLVIIRRRRG